MKRMTMEYKHQPIYPIVAPLTQHCVKWYKRALWYCLSTLSMVVQAVLFAAAVTLVIHGQTVADFIQTLLGSN